MNAESADPAFPRLFTPLQIGPVTVPNRILSSGHDTVMAVDGLVTDRLIAYHEARAAGGAGLIVTQVVGVHESARYTSHVLMGTDDAAIDGFRRLADAVHAHGTKIFAQIFHPGREIMEGHDGSLPVALAPSNVPNERFHVTPRALPVSLIAEIVDGYAQATRRLQQAGFDGVEIVASHGYLPAQLLSPRVNLRTDAYGGSAESRLRFLREVIAAIAAAVGDTMAVGMRISVGEHSPDGLTPDEALAACVALDSDLDYLHVTVGTSETLAGADHIVPPMSDTPGYTAPVAAALKARVSAPVFVAGRVNQPQEAEQILAAGQADAVVMTRALICDPLMPTKARSGRAEEIRACIACNQACIGHFHSGYPISCIQRPETGRELEYGTLRPASTPRRVLVVGGGPAGMKAAVTAAARGHQVVLAEAGRRLGGQVLLAEKLPGRAEFGGAATNLAGEIARLGIDLRLKTRIDADMVRELAPEVVIVATGARPRQPALEADDDAMPVLGAWEVLDGAPLPKGRIVVLDWRCDWVGLGVAIQIAETGRRTTLAVCGYHAGELLQQYVRDAMLARAARAGVEIIPLVRPYGADEDTVYLQHVLTDDPVILDGVAAMVTAYGHEQVDDLLAALIELTGDTGQQVPGLEVHGIGDCLAPRTVEEAVLEGLRIGAAI